MRPPHQLGAVVPAIRLENGVGLMVAPLVLPDRTFETVPWAAGEQIVADWSHVSWYAINRQSRIHLVTGGELATGIYIIDKPWLSEPQGGGTYTAGTSISSATYNGLYCLVGITNDPGDTLSWSGSGGLTLSEAEQYAFDTSLSPDGHAGYAFASISGTGVINIASSGSPTERFWGVLEIHVESGSPAFTTIVAADTESGSTTSMTSTLDVDIDPGSQIVPVTFFTPTSVTNYNGFVAGGNAMDYPTISNYTRELGVQLAPYARAVTTDYGINHFPVWRHIGGAGPIVPT